MMNRRHLLTTVSATLALAGCNSLPTLPVDVKVALPASIQGVIDDASAIVAKVEAIKLPSIGGLIDDAKGMIADLSTATGDAKSIVTKIVSVLGTVATLLPAPWGTVALAIETLLPLMGNAVGMKMMARRPTGMSPDRARMVLKS